MITVSKSELKSKMLEYFRKIEKSGEDIIVTNNRKPVLKVSLLRSKQTPDVVFGNYRDKIHFYEDIMTDTSDEWEEK
jgi:hypothetical protein